MSEPPEIQRLQSNLASLQEKVERLDREVAAEKKEARDRENARLKWGIGAIGAVAMALLSFVLSQIGDLMSAGRQ